MEFSPGPFIWNAPWPRGEFGLSIVFVLLLVYSGTVLSNRYPRYRILGVLLLLFAALFLSQVVRVVWRDGLQDGASFLSSYPRSTVRIVLAATVTLVAGYWYALNRRFRRAV